MGSGTRDFSGFFHPKSIAIIGVSTGAYRFGGMSFLNKLLESRYPGMIFPINPKADEIRGLKAYPDLTSLPEVPDLVMVCVAARFVPSVLEECGRIGARWIHILTSGFKETGTREGKDLDDRVRAIARERNLMVVGPNCMGTYCPASGLTPWGAIPGQSGPLGVISQSGNMTQRLTEYAYSLGIGVDKAVSFGNATVLGATDFLEFMASDEKIRAIAMYLEGIEDGRRFFELASEVNREKPIVLWKGGESEAGARTAASHTGAMAAGRGAWEAFFTQTGVCCARSMNEWMDTVMALTFLPAAWGKRVFLVGGGGGNSVAQGDTCTREGLEVPRLSESTMAQLRQSVPEAGSIAGNPLDMFRTFQDAAYLAEILDLAYKDPFVDMVVVDRIIPRRAFHLPDLPDSTPQVIRFLQDRPGRKPTVLTVDADGGDPELAARGAELRRRFCAAGFPAYPSLDRAARALSSLYRYHALRRRV
jgi:acyl-CoA synthetase (NDP forming)